MSGGTPPRFVPCKCGHAKILHEGHDLEPKCVSRLCGCPEYRPDTPSSPTTPPPLPRAAAATPAAPVPVAQPAAATAPRRGVLEAAKATGVAAFIRRAERIENLVKQLGDDLREHQGKDSARAEIAELERQLAEKKAALKKARPAKDGPTSQSEPGSFACAADDCGRSFDSNQGLLMHARRVHEGFNPNAASA